MYLKERRKYDKDTEDDGAKDKGVYKVHYRRGACGYGAFL
jgi:hypothetical protein